MSDHIPFDIQSEIIKTLPVKSLLQFRSVSKQWKSHIDDPKFIKNYHINHSNLQHHLLVWNNLQNVKTCTSFVDNNTFPEQKFPLTAPESLQLLIDPIILSSVDGLLCFYGDVDSETTMAIIWNPTIRKSVRIVIPKVGYIRLMIGFGVCPDTSDPRLVNISIDRISNMWVVEVFTLSTRGWKTIYTDEPSKSCEIWAGLQVFVNGVICFLAHDERYWDDGVKSNFIISFDLKSEKFGEVSLPERLLHAPRLILTNVNESLGLLEYRFEGKILVFDVWSMKDDLNKSFTKIYTIKVVGMSVIDRVLAFRNNGEVVIQVQDKNNYEFRIEVYEPLSGLISGVGINGNRRSFSAKSYMETLLLLDESDSIGH